jgi:uridine kinase
MGELAREILARAQQLARPCVVALDGRSGAGKSTLARQLVDRLDASVVDGDAFFAGGIELRSDSPRARARDCIDWRRQRPVLEALRANRAATYVAFDWEAFDGRLETTPIRCEPRAVIVHEGVYSARPELADLVDLRVLVRASDDVRTARLLAREGTLGPWERQWHEAEDWYFAHEATPAWFDVIVDTDT